MPQVPIPISDWSALQHSKLALGKILWSWQKDWDLSSPDPPTGQPRK